MTPTGALISVAKDDIDERANGQSGMPQDIAKNLTRAELRDLVEYLTTLQSEPTTVHGKHDVTPPVQDGHSFPSHGHETLSKRR